MSLRLTIPGLVRLAGSSQTPWVGRICDSQVRDTPTGPSEILLVRRPLDQLPAGFRGYLFIGLEEDSRRVAGEAFAVPDRGISLAHGDVVRIDARHGVLAILFRPASSSNTFLLTERCDNRCLMCPQPPRESDDEGLLTEFEEVLPLIPPDTTEVGLSGGEPALLGDRLIDVLRALTKTLPQTSVHLLTNGRRFSNREFAEALGRIGHPDLMVAVPLYSDLPEEHDYIVQAHGAYDETILGILNLKRAGIPVEVRMVIHKETYERLPDYARFLTRNLLFVDHVALMGLELEGLARRNHGLLWIDPLDYQKPMAAATQMLARAGMAVSIYNQPLCVLPAELQPFAVKSISDWKRVYFPECKHCARREDCGGSFYSVRHRRSRGIAPIR